MALYSDSNSLRHWLKSHRINLNIVTLTNHQSGTNVRVTGSTQWQWQWLTISPRPSRGLGDWVTFLPRPISHDHVPWRPGQTLLFKREQAWTCSWSPSNSSSPGTQSRTLKSLGCPLQVAGPYKTLLKVCGSNLVQTCSPSTICSYYLLIMRMLKVKSQLMLHPSTDIFFNRDSTCTRISD